MVTIRWTQRAAGRSIGDVETLERTPFIEAVIAAGRVVVVSEDASPVETPPDEVPPQLPFEEEAPKPARRAKPIVGGLAEVDDGAPGTE